MQREEKEKGVLGEAAAEELLYSTWPLMIMLIICSSSNWPGR
jgi:hypothetical protein